MALHENLLNVFLGKALSFYVENQHQGNRNDLPAWKIWV